MPRPDAVVGPALRTPIEATSPFLRACTSKVSLNGLIQVRPWTGQPSTPVAVSFPKSPVAATSALLMPTRTGPAAPGARVRSAGESGVADAVGVSGVVGDSSTGLETEAFGFASFVVPSLPHAVSAPRPPARVA